MSAQTPTNAVPTPRTDAFCLQLINKPLDGLDRERLADFARILERENIALRAALVKIANYDGESIWMDDRDDAAGEMLNIARAAVPDWEKQ